MVLYDMVLNGRTGGRMVNGRMVEHNCTTEGICNPIHCYEQAAFTVYSLAAALMCIAHNFLWGYCTSALPINLGFVAPSLQRSNRFSITPVPE